MPTWVECQSHNMQGFRGESHHEAVEQFSPRDEFITAHKSAYDAPLRRTSANAGGETEWVSKSPKSPIQTIETEADVLFEKTAAQNFLLAAESSRPKCATSANSVGFASRKTETRCLKHSTARLRKNLHASFSTRSTDRRTTTDCTSNFSTYLCLA